MRTRVKFCGLTRPGDVDAAVAAGVDAVGFVFFERSPRCVDEVLAQSLRCRLPSFVRAVGLFVNEGAARIEAVAAAVGLDVIQLHGDEPPALGASLRSIHWRAHRVGEGYDLAAEIAAHGAAEFHLLDSASAGYGGSGRAFDWTRADGIDPARLIVSGGLDAGNVGAAIARLGPFAVDTSSGIQGKGPRDKDAAKMERFIDSVRAADQRRAQPPNDDAASPRTP